MAGAHFFGDHLRDAKVAVGFEALRRADDGRAAGRGDGAADAAPRGNRATARRKSRAPAPASARSRSWVTETVAGSVTSGRYTTLARRARHVVDDASDRAPTAGRRGRPGSGARPAPYPNFPLRAPQRRRHQARAPSRRSVPARRRTRLPRCRKRMSTEAAHAAVSVAVEYPVAYAIGGRAIVASTDPRDTYLRRPRRREKHPRTPAARPRASARKTRRTRWRRLFLPGTEATPGRCGRRSRPTPQRPATLAVAAQPHGQRDARGALRDVEHATSTPARTPEARSTFAAPMLPLPMRRRSSAPHRRDSRSANGTEPMQYATR